MPGNVELWLKKACFRSMSYQLMRHGSWSKEEEHASKASALLEVTDWHLALQIAVAYAYLSQIVHRHGDRYAGSCEETDSVRAKLSLKDLPLQVDVSPRSLCFAENCSGEVPDWIVYAATGRHPHVKSVTSLPANVAGWFFQRTFVWGGRPTSSFTMAMV